jgi:transposase-like protein
VLAQVPKGSAEMVAAAIRTTFAQPGPVHVAEQLDTIATMLGRQFPKVEQMLRDNADDITAFAAYLVAHWKKIWSTGFVGEVHGVPRRANLACPFKHVSGDPLDDQGCRAERRL